jgi:hypothetical protein
MNQSLLKKYNFDIDATVNTYAGELALPYVTAALLGAETIAKGRCRFLEGIVGDTVISGLATSDTIQAGGSAACAWNDGSNIALTEQVLSPAQLAVMESICRGTMYPTWIAANGRMQRNGDLPVDWTDFLLGAVAERTGTNLEEKLWVADAAGVFGVGFLSNDGVIDEAGIDASACADFTEATVAATFTAANILAQMGIVFDAAAGIAGILGKPGCGFYLSYEAYAFFLQAVAGQASGPGYQTDLTGQVTFLGYPVYATHGITNVYDVIVFTYPDNLVVGANSYTADISAQLIPTYQYDGSDEVRVALRFACGVQTAVAADGVVGFAFT